MQKVIHATLAGPTIKPSGAASPASRTVTVRACKAIWPHRMAWASWIGGRRREQHSTPPKLAAKGQSKTLAAKAAARGPPRCAAPPKCDGAKNNGWHAIRYLQARRQDLSGKGQTSPSGATKAAARRYTPKSLRLSAQNNIPRCARRGSGKRSPSRARTPSSKPAPAQPASTPGIRRRRCGTAPARGAWSGPACQIPAQIKAQVAQSCWPMRRGACGISVIAAATSCSQCGTLDGHVDDKRCSVPSSPPPGGSSLVLDRGDMRKSRRSPVKEHLLVFVGVAPVAWKHSDQLRRLHS